MDFFYGYFSATKSQIHSTLVLLVLIVLLIFWPLIEAVFTGKTLTFPSPQTVFANQPNTELLNKRRLCKPFYPDQLFEKDWVDLGFSKLLAVRIMKYHLRHPIQNYKDLTCIYGIDSLLLQALKPCMLFHKQVDQSTHKAISSTALLEINSADTLALEQLPFIGMKLAKRIIDYRTRLGGFVSLDQLLELYGLKQEQFDQLSRYLKVNPNLVHQILINEVNFDQFRLHPYITYTQAKVILNYRQQHGPFASSIDLQKTMVLDDVQLNKLLPYLKF